MNTSTRARIIPTPMPTSTRRCRQGDDAAFPCFPIGRTPVGVVVFAFGRWVWVRDARGTRGGSVSVPFDPMGRWRKILFGVTWFDDVKTGIAAPPLEI
jgi:hypothetical protein